MSLDLATRLKIYLASAPPALRIIQTLEFSHPAMSPYDDPGTSQAFYIWREPYEGSITTEHGVRTVLPVNFEVKLAGTQANLDQTFEIRIGTVGIEDEFRDQLDLIPIDTLDKVRCVYREYLSDDLTDILASGVLEVERISYEVGIAVLSAVQPRLNVTRTGELYTPRTVPMLRRLF